VEDLRLLSVSRKGAGSSRSGEAGTITAIALLVLAILSVLGLSLLDLSVRDAQVSTNYGQATQSLYAAEAGVESAYQQIKILTSSGNVNAAAGVTPSKPVISVPGGGSYNFSTLTWAALFVDCLTTPTLPQCRQPITTGPYQGLIASTQNYLVTSEVTAPNQSRARVVQAVQAGLIGLFQFAVFYDQILEIFPGQPMTLLGRVHSNNNIYLGSGYLSDKLKIDSYLTSAQNIYRYRLDTGVTPSSAQIKDASGAYQYLDKDHSAADWASWALATYNGLVRDSALQATPLNVPINLAGGENPHQLIEKGLYPGDSYTLQQQKLYWQADYRIIVDSGGTVRVWAGDFGSEHDVTASHDPTPFLTTNTNFYDKREGKCMQAAQVDVGALRTAAGWNFTKGVLYVSSAKAPTGTCGTGTPNAPRTPAVRLTNGTELPYTNSNPAQNLGFTVATDRPIYVQGDYNTKDTTGALHNGNDATTPPASVMGDAVTVLSNNWGTNSSDTKGNDAVTNRSATNTTMYAGVVSGVKATVAGSSYSGGLENYFRLLEDWTSRTLTYRGSMVTLYQSAVATGTWQATGNYYNAPTRDWSFDTLFNIKLPPGTPRVQVTQRLGWWHQE
jgi:Tfp pilus assembly protein PilX